MSAAGGSPRSAATAGSARALRDAWRALPVALVLLLVLSSFTGNRLP